jgi:hypothetical protein
MRAQFANSPYGFLYRAVYPPLPRSLRYGCSTVTTPGPDATLCKLQAETQL